MDGKMDQIKGRIKEAAGVLLDDDSLKNEGKLDQVGGKVKEQAEKAAEKVKEKVGRVKGKLQRAVETMKEALAGRGPRRPSN
jgi:uncharacterized protein YjbJ (UPF0337 family)